MHCLQCTDESAVPGEFSRTDLYAALRQIHLQVCYTTLIQLITAQCFFRSRVHYSSACDNRHLDLHGPCKYHNKGQHTRNVCTTWPKHVTWLPAPHKDLTLVRSLQALVHFYSAASRALAALNWCESQPISAVSLTDFEHGYRSVSVLLLSV